MPAPTAEDLADIRELIMYWRIRRDEADKIVKSLLYDERIIQDHLDAI